MFRLRSLRPYAVFVASLALALAAGSSFRPMSANAASDYPLVTADRLMNAGADDGWLMFRRTYNSQGFAPFDEITQANVTQLKPIFTYDTGMKQGHEAAPLVNGRIMFITTPMDHVVALDAVSGKVLWTYKPTLPAATLKTICCDVVNRGVALYDGLVYVATLDNRVVALDAQTGKVRWSKSLMPPGVGYAMSAAPLVVDGKVITGIAGGEYGARGFIVALDAMSGSVAWKTYTIPAPSEPGGKTWPAGMYKTGGGSTWLTGSYDPDTKTLFWGVGNPGPWLADLRPGRNLYTDSVIALDPENGKLKWYYQYTPHDTWDYDGTSESVLADITYKGAPVKALLHADRNGYVFALDRTNGHFLYAKPFTKATSVVGVASDGTPKTDDTMRPHLGKSIFTCPSFLGGKNWWPTAYDPDSETLFVPTAHWCMTMKGTGTDYKAGLPFLGETFEVRPQPGSDGYGEVQAIDAKTGTQKWAYHTKLPWNGPLLATKGGLVFGGSVDGQFMAFDASSGKVLWSYKTSSGIIGVPTSYRVDGKQYVAVLAGYGGATPIWGGLAAKATANIPLGGKLYVFALP